MHRWGSFGNASSTPRHRRCVGWSKSNEATSFSTALIERYVECSVEIN
jgi:hypothetical protein